MLKKILYLSDVSLDNVGGAQESMKIIMEGLKKDFEFYMITPNSTMKFNNQIIFKEYEDFVIKGRNKWKILKLLFKIKLQINKIKPDIIHVQMPSTMLLIGLLKTLNLIPKSIKIYYTDRGVLDKYGKMTRLLIGKFTTKFDYTITTTNYNRSLYLKNNFIDREEKVIVIPNTAGSLFNEYSDDNRKKMRESYSIKEDELVIGFSGRLSDDKNWPLAIKIIEELNRNKTFKVVVAVGTNKTIKHIEEAEAFIKEITNIIGEKRVISFVDLPIEKMPNFYYLNDIFILTSKVESFGRTAVEAMSRKNIVFGTKVDGLEEVIFFEENKYSTTKEFIWKIKRISEDNLKKEKEKFLRHYKQNYSLSKCLNKYREIYEEI